MRPYIQSKRGIPGGVNFYAAYQGFSEMGLECALFESTEELDTSLRADIVVGGLGIVDHVLARFDAVPEHVNYPEELRPFMGRRIWESTLTEINNDTEAWPVFVKPIDEKRFTGILVTGTKSLVGLGTSGLNPRVICSDPVDFVAEWRCFVRYGVILDVRPYLGDWRAHFDPDAVEAMVAAYTSAPAGYALDVGVTRDGRTLLVEVNDGYSLGSYGLQHNLYAKLLEARWAEMVDVPDECNF